MGGLAVQNPEAAGFEAQFAGWPDNYQIRYLKHYYFTKASQTLELPLIDVQNFDPVQHAPKEGDGKHFVEKPEEKANIVALRGQAFSKHRRFVLRLLLESILSSSSSCSKFSALLRKVLVLKFGGQRVAFGRYYVASSLLTGVKM